MREALDQLIANWELQANAWRQFAATYAATGQHEAAADRSTGAEVLAGCAEQLRRLVAVGDPAPPDAVIGG